MTGILEEIKKSKPETEGYVWVNMLIKFGLNGSAVVVRSFTKPAKESYIKKQFKPKDKKDEIEIEKTEKPEKTTKLF